MHSLGLQVAGQGRRHLPIHLRQQLGQLLHQVDLQPQVDQRLHRLYADEAAPHYHGLADLARQRPRTVSLSASGTVVREKTPA